MRRDRRAASCWTVVGLVLALAACEPYGHHIFDSTHARDVHPGQEQSQIVAWFGEPDAKGTFTETARGCVERWLYRRGHQPGGSSRAQRLIVDFDAKGMVCGTVFAEVTPR
jgi:hypothetical protein